MLHYTAMADGAAAERALCDPAREVSAHYLISAQGTVIPLVEEEMRAWHAGIGSWRGRGDVNSRSIGIELDNDGASPFAAPLMDALDGLLRGLLARWNIPPQGVIAHSDMAPGRKIDPGPRFDWLRLAKQGLSIWPERNKAIKVDAEAFTQNASRFGYPEMDIDLMVSTLRLRFRPRVTGPLDGTDCAIMADLATRFGD